MNSAFLNSFIPSVGSEATPSTHSSKDQYTGDNRPEEHLLEFQTRQDTTLHYTTLINQYTYQIKLHRVLLK